MPVQTTTGSFGIGFRKGWSDWQKDLPGCIAWAKDHDFACLDLPGDAEAVKSVLDAGLGVGSVDLLEFKAIITEDAGRRRAAVDANLAMIDAVAPLGAKRFFTVMLPADPSLERARNFELCVESYRPIIERLASHGARLAIEGYPGPGALCCTPETCRAFFEAFDTDFPRVAGINYDPSHLIRLHVDPMRFLREFVDHVVHIHGKDTQIDTEAIYQRGTEQPWTLEQPVAFGGTFWRYCLPGHGEFTWTAAFEVLKDAGYDGHVSIELEDYRYNGTEEGEKRGLLVSQAALASF